MMPIGAFIRDALTTEEETPEEKKPTEEGKQLQRSLAQILPGPAANNDRFITQVGELLDEYRKLWVPYTTSIGAHPAQFERLAKAGVEFKDAIDMLNEQGRSLVKQHLLMDHVIASFSEIERAADLALLSAQAAKRFP
jgi:hypothetical protein